MYWNSSDNYQKEVESWRNDPAYKTNLQTMRILVNTEWFQTLVLEARKANGIPVKGVVSRLYDIKEIGAYLVLQPVNDERDFFIRKILTKSGLPTHFSRAIKNYIFYNYLSAPILDFVFHANCSGCDKHLPELPQLKTFKGLDSNQNILSKKIFNILSKDKYSPLLIERIDPKKELENKLSFMRRIGKVEAKLHKEYKTINTVDKEYDQVKDEDIATFLSKSNSPKAINKIVKKIRNTRQYISNLHKERAIPQD